MPLPREQILNMPPPPNVDSENALTVRRLMINFCEAYLVRFDNRLAAELYDQIRRRRVPILPLEDALPESFLRDTSPGPEAALVQRQREEDVQRMLRHLAAADRAVIVLRYWDDLSYEDMAGVLQTSVSGVKSRLHRARKQLATLSPRRTRLAAEGTQRVDAPAV